MNYIFYYDTIIGRIGICDNGRAVTKITLNKNFDQRKYHMQVTNLNALASIEINSYLQGNSHSFTFPIELQGTSFQKAVWEQLKTIPYGKTASYKEIAEKIKVPTASRAVGNACLYNPLFLVIPCHRVIGNDGSLVGFSYGIELKKKLLTIESTRKYFGV
jgi:methylated-DNA-[protein]-cysteine S-methyltransferase